jgi:hypothetical protein
MEESGRIQKGEKNRLSNSADYAGQQTEFPIDINACSERQSLLIGCGSFLLLLI